MRAHDWARIVALAGLPPGAAPADVIAGLDRRQAGKDAARAEREARAETIRARSRCDPSGWLLDPDGAPMDPATRCDHRPAAVMSPPAGRDITEPLHEPPSERVP
ncbi:hypothetical protein ABQF26_04405 [Mycolicibacterium elephantis]